MIHIVFNTADVEVLKKVFLLDESIIGSIIEIKDDYAVGPISNIFKEEGKNSRKNWWRMVLESGDLDGFVDNGIVDDAKQIEIIHQQLQEDPNQVVWIWAAQNKHDVSGYFWLMSQLAVYQSRIFILYLNNLPFFNEKGSIFYPNWLHVIPPKEFIKAKKLARPITLSEFETDPDEWKRLMDEDKMVRLLEGGKKLTQYDENFYDKDLFKFISKDWQKAYKVIQQFLQKNTHTTGDAYLLWRIKSLINAEKIEAKGLLKGMKDFEVRLIPESLENA
jgi:hypothetical protein